MGNRVHESETVSLRVKNQVKPVFQSYQAEARAVASGKTKIGPKSFTLLSGQGSQ